jgi:hypothetical protein
MTRPVRVGITGTFDLENYGDLLFPLLAQHALERRLGHVEAVALSYHDRDPGSWPYAVTSLTRLPEVVGDLDALLIGGGFLVRFDPDVAPGYGPAAPHIHHPTGNWLTPALLALAADVPVIWNAPGMHENAIPAWAVPLLREVLSGSSYVAVRDEPSREHLSRVGGTAIDVVPDTAFALSGLLEGLTDADRSGIREGAGLTGPYIVVQAAEASAPFVDWLDAHPQAQEGLQVLELPISPVLGEHGGTLGPLRPGHIRPDGWPTPVQIAVLIGGAEAVVGHSYHLAITALQCGVPVFTPVDLTEGKYQALLDAPLAPMPRGSAAPEAFRSGLGRRPMAATIRERQADVNAHWDRVATAITAGPSGGSAGLGRFLQELPAWLEAATVAEAEVLHAQAVQHRADAAEQGRVLEKARTLIAVRDAQLGQIARTRSWRVTAPLRRFNDIRKRVHPARRVLDLRAISGARLQTEPYRWGAVHGLFSAQDGAELAATYPHDRFKLLTGHGGEKDYSYHARSLVGMGATRATAPTYLSPVWRALADHLMSEDYRTAMALLTGLDLTGTLLEVNVFHFGPGSELGPHPDLPEKLLTHVFYFNERWKAADGGCLSILRSPDPGSVVAQIPPIVGSSSVIVRSADSWHAVQPVVAGADQSRRSMTVTFYRPGSISSMWPVGDTSPLVDYGPGTGG